MSTNKKSLTIGVIAGVVTMLVIGTLMTTLTSATLSFSSNESDTNMSDKEVIIEKDEPLYWVAPMDANFQRDKPGKSPMGMDLVPVYANPTTQASKEKEPLYWVAPMDANFKRDKPGKSPMGMDLVPVYPPSTSANNEGAGTVQISPNVINNLGVRTVEAKIKIPSGKINTVGYVTYDEDKLIHIHPRVEGWIEKLYVKTTGSTVIKDQPLYDMYSPELVNAQEEYVLALGRQSSRLVKAAENRLMSLKLSSAQITKLKKSRKVNQLITFYAPQNGVVENLKVREGFFVQPGIKLMSIGDLSEVWIEAEVFERQAAQVHVGSPVTVNLDYIPGKNFSGYVDFIYPTLDLKTRALKVRLRLNNDSGALKPNMYAQVLIHTHDQLPALLIPREALIRTGTQDRVVLALGGGSFKSIAVKVGRFDGDFVEILSGISEGESVVSSAQFLLDSESSKTSDFQRLNHEESTNTSTYSDETMSGMADMSEMASNKVSSASTKGVIDALMLNHRMVTIAREAIEKWQRPAATVDFLIDEKLDINLFSKGSTIEFTFEIQGDDFVIVEVKQTPGAKL